LPFGNRCGTLFLCFNFNLSEAKLLYFTISLNRSLQYKLGRCHDVK
jgi:hypothetical protein